MKRKVQEKKAINNLEYVIFNLINYKTGINIIYT